MMVAWFSIDSGDLLRRTVIIGSLESLQQLVRQTCTIPASACQREPRIREQSSSAAILLAAFFLGA